MCKAKGGILFFAAACIFVNLYLAGCNAPKDQLQVFNSFFEASDYENSALFAQKKISKRKTPAGEDLLWSLQLASVERICLNYQKSTETFDKAEDMLKYYDEQSELADAIGSTAVNDNIIPYKGEEYDGVIVNTYKAFNFMAEGKMDLARVEFNRALDRQRRAKEKFNEEIRKFKAELEKKQTTNANIKSNVEDPNIIKMLTARYPNLYEFEAYPDFVNPFATYSAGIYFALVKDFAKAADLFKESYGMVSDNNYIVEDLAATEAILDGNGKLGNTVWLIFENGLGPVKEEFRLDIPLFIATSKVKYMGIALPKLVFRNHAYPYLQVCSGDATYKTRVVVDMDRVVQTEFSKDYKAILARAIISATIKAAAQYAMEQNDSSAGSILMAIYAFATTSADVRIWTALPKDFQVARFNMPANRIITVVSPDGIQLLNIEIPNCENAIIYVKIPSRTAAPSYSVIAL